MPIFNVSDRRRIPRLGKIHLGVKVEKFADKGNVVSSHPKAVPWFVCPPEVVAVYGEQPTELDIIFPVDDKEIIASQWLKYYSRSRGLLCKGDGRMAMALVDVVTGEIAKKDTDRTELRAVTCNPNTCQQYATGYCKERISLQFMLPKIPGLGVYQIDSSYWSLVNVNSCLEVVTSICGKVSGIPLILALVPQEVQPNGKKKTVRVLQIKINQRIGQLVQSKPFALEGSQSLQLAPPEELSPEEVTEPTDYADEETEEGPPPPPPAEQRITAQSMITLMQLLGVDSTDALLTKSRERWPDSNLQRANEMTEASADIWIKQLQKYNVRPVSAQAPLPAPPQSLVRKDTPPVTEEESSKRRANLMLMINRDLGADVYRDVIMPEIAHRWAKAGLSDLLPVEMDEIQIFVNQQIALRKTSPTPAPAPTAPAPATAQPAPPATKPAPAATKKAVAKPKTTREAPVKPASTGNEVKAFIASLLNGGYKDDEIKKILFESTGKKGGWDATDVEKAKTYLASKGGLDPAKAAAKAESDARLEEYLFGKSAPVGGQNQDAEAFLKEQEG